MSELTMLVTPLRAGLQAEGSTILEVLVQIQAPAAPADLATDRSPLNLALVLDRSGSMSGQPLAAAKQAAEAILERLTPQDRLALVAYDGNAKVLVSGRQVEDPRVFAAAIRQLRSGGNTNLHGGWAAGLGEVLPGAAPGRISRVLLLSDGQANEGVTDPGLQAKAAAEAAGQGVGTSTYGLGNGFNEALMVELARHGQGRSYYGETAEDLLDPFLEEFAFLSARCASEVHVGLQTAPGLAVAQATNHLPSGQGSWRLPDLTWSSEVWMVLRLEVVGADLPVEQGGRAVLSVRAAWKDRDGQGRQLPYQPLVLPLLEPAAFAALPAHPVVAKRLLELAVAECEERAYRAAQWGDRDGVQAALDELKRLGKDDAWTRERARELELLAKDADLGRLSKEVAFSTSEGMGYHTRSLNDDRPDEEKEAYLRRKKRQGKGGGSNPDPGSRPV